MKIAERVYSLAQEQDDPTLMIAAYNGLAATRSDFAKSSLAVDTVGADFLAREPAMSFGVLGTMERNAEISIMQRIFRSATRR
jgi:hypothetical protein